MESNKPSLIFIIALFAISHAENEVKPLIYEGFIASRGQFPYQALLRIFNSLVCGAIGISSFSYKFIDICQIDLYSSHQRKLCADCRTLRV